LSRPARSPQERRPGSTRAAGGWDHASDADLAAASPHFLRMTTDRQVLFLGGRLETWAARQAAAQVLDDYKLRAGAKPDPLRRCRRMSARRVDCPNIQVGTCQSIVAVLLRDDGLPYLRRYYSTGSGPRCRLRRHPAWDGEAEPADPL
jgi:hypothetical protein